jgi:hypothetical protein
MDEKHLGFRIETKRFGRRFSTILLTSILILSLAVTYIPQAKAQQQMEIAYDDDGCEIGTRSFAGRQSAVLFSLPDGWFKAKLLKAKIYIWGSSQVDTKIYVYNRNREREGSLDVTFQPKASGEWVEVDLSLLNLIVDGDFYISLYWSESAANNLSLGCDSDNIQNRSYHISDNWYPQSSKNYMIRAVVELYIPSREPDWSTPDEVIDLDVSADGSIVAAATSEGLKVYDAAGNQLWNWSQTNCTVTAVSVSDDGNVVVAAIQNNTVSSEYRLLFWKDAKTLSGENPAYSWSSVNLGGTIGIEALDVSSDGNQVVAVGTGMNVFYWNGTLGLSGGDNFPWWYDYLGYWLEFVDISDDGDVITILGKYTMGGNGDGEKGVYYDAFVYKNCTSRTGPQQQSYNLTYSFGSAVKCGGIALSDDGLYVVAGVGNYTYFFNTSMTENWAPQWRCSLKEFEWVVAVDISSDGNTVVAVTNEMAASPSNLLIFQNAVSKAGIVSADCEFTLARDYTEHDYIDVSVDGAGSLAAAGTGDYLFAVNASTGEPLWLYNGTYTTVSTFVRVSENGQVIVSAGSEIDSLHFFSLGPKTAVVTFDHVGVGSDYTKPVLNVDGVNYTISSLPASFTWDVGSSHTFEFYEMLYVDGKRYVWKETKGLSTGRSGTITVPGDGGYVNATYKTQYLVTVTASPSEAQGGTFKITFTSCGTTFK